MPNGVSLNAKRRVERYLESMADEYGKIQESMLSIGRSTDLSDAAVCRTLHELEREGLIKLVRPKRRNVPVLIVLRSIGSSFSR